MLHSFLANNRVDLIARCVDKVAKRPKRNASEKQLQTGIPIFCPHPHVMMRLSFRSGCFIMERFGLTLSHGQNGQSPATGTS
jgi:hypothetical protein